MPEPTHRAEYVRVGTWLLPEAYGQNYDHFTMTKAKLQKEVCIPVYAKVEDLMGSPYEHLALLGDGTCGDVNA